MLRVVLALLTVFVFVVGWSAGHALTVPGGGTFAERVAEWARSHYLGPLVTFGEWLSYTPPKVGGSPDVSFTKLGGSAVRACKARGGQVALRKVRRAGGGKAQAAAYCQVDHGLEPIIPANLTSLAGRPLPGEGVWRAAVFVHGVPAVLKTYIRWSKVYSSYYAGIVSMDQRLLKFSLRPGTLDPGPGNWGAPMDIPPGQRRGLVATFNSGFRLNAARGGFYLNGHYAGALVRGAASEVYYKDGRMVIGTWGRNGLQMGPDVAGVRQNLKPIVIGGQVPASVNQNVETNWGSTLNGAYYVWRSGVGITSDGRIVFVYGDKMDAASLARLLQHAGCVYAMELDINPDWMSFMYYLTGHHPGNPTPVDLLQSQVQSPYRYYSVANRDFTAVYAR